MKPAKAFTREQFDEFEKLKFSANLCYESARKFAEILLQIRERGYYLIESDDWDDWLSKTAQAFKWNIKSLSAAFRKEEARRLIEQTTGEPIIERSHAAKKEDKVGVGTPAASAPVAHKEVKSPKVFDATGYEVHHSILETWNRRNELDPIAAQIAEFKRFIEQMRDEEDPIFSKIHQDILLKLKSAVYYLGVAKLEYVCGYCQGKCVFLQQPCANCDSTGLMTKLQWDRLVPEEFKNARRK